MMQSLIFAYGYMLLARLFFLPSFIAFPAQIPSAVLASNQFVLVLFLNHITTRTFLVTKPYQFTSR